jgi:hypothetical protein
MSLKGWGLALLTAPPTLGISLLVYFWIWFLSKVGKFYIGAMAFSIKALVGLILLPFKLVFSILGKSFDFVEFIFHDGVENLKKSDGGSGASVVLNYKLRYVPILVLALFFLDYQSLVIGLVEGPTTISTIGFWIEFLFKISLIAVPFVSVIVISAFSTKIFGEEAGAAATQQAEQASAVGQAVGGAAAGVKTAREAKETVDSVNELRTTVAETEELEGLAGLLEGSALEGLAAGAGPIALALVLAWIYYTALAAVISAVLVAFTWAFVAQIIPIFAAPVLGALGVGNAYLQWVEGASTNIVGPQLENSLEVPTKQVEEVFAKLGCVAEGPQCLREWRLNNTVRPGSEAQGEKYELRIARFGLGADRVDTAFKEADYTLPINFLVENTRNGLKGITARDVEYRITVESFNKVHCTTGWRGISTFPGQGRNDILPGLGVSPTDDLEELNLGRCELLQPSMGQNRVVNMEIKYNYSSQATLSVDAMSRKNRREQGITPGFEKSRTADTPVQSYVNVKAPVTFFQSEDGGRTSVPFPARFGFSTPGFEIEYKVMPESVEIRDSQLTDHVEDSCSGLEPVEGDLYRVSDRAENRIELRQNNSWFSTQTDPAPLRCTFEIEEDALPLISPTGEQLIMRVDGNYTVKRERTMGSFNIVNTECTDKNCPMLVTKTFDDDISKWNLSSACTLDTSVDAQGGCSIRVPERTGENPTNIGSTPWRMDWQIPRLAERNGQDITVEKGETAYRWSGIKDNITSELDGENVKTYSNADILATDEPDTPDVLGVDTEKFEEAMGKNGISIYVRRDRAYINPLDNKICSGSDPEKLASSIEEAFSAQGTAYVRVNENNGCRGTTSCGPQEARMSSENGYAYCY